MYHFAISIRLMTTLPARKVRNTLRFKPLVLAYVVNTDGYTWESNGDMLHHCISELNINSYNAVPLKGRVAILTQSREVGCRESIASRKHDCQLISATSLSATLAQQATRYCLCYVKQHITPLPLPLASQSRSPWRGVFEPSLSLTSHGSGLPLQRLERGSGCSQICCFYRARGGRLEEGGTVEEGDKRWRLVSSLFFWGD